MKGQPTFPIKIKLVLLLTGLLTAAILLFTFLAMKLFTEDKMAYVYENGLAKSSSLARELESEISRGKELMRSMGEALFEDKKGKELALKLFNTEGKFIEFLAFDKSRRELVRILDQEFLDSQGFSREQYLLLTKDIALPIDKILRESYIIESSDLNQIPHLLLGMKDERGNFLIGRMKSGPLVDALNRNKVYQSLLYDSFGRVVMGSAGNLPEVTASQIRKFMEDGEGVTKIAGKNTDWLLSFSKIPGQELLVTAFISEEKALEVIGFLKEKSLYTALFILSFGLIIAALFTKQLTKPIEQLSQATQRIAQGDFATQTKVDSNDEIGVLASSFNYMSSEILRFTEEIKDKARMENELKVGQLVQERFIPPKELTLGPVIFYSFFQSASECGGDIWGVWEDQASIYFYVADASGHGVPAALLTAAVKAFFDTILEDKEVGIRSPGLLMEKLNNVVVKAGGGLNMTLFLARYDKRAHELTYANASHPPGLLFVCKEEVSKQDIQSLTGALGPRLGEKVNVSYPEKTIPVGEGQNLLLYTDGIVECSSKEGKAFGERRLIKSALEALNTKNANIVEAIARDGFKHFEGNPPDDDITIIQASFHRFSGEEA